MRRKYTQRRSIKKEPAESSELESAVEVIQNPEPDATDTVPCVESVENNTDTNKPPIADSDADKKEEEFDVEKILEKRVINGMVRAAK